MTTVRIGRYVNGPEADIGQVGASAQRACVYDATTQTVIVYRLGAWLGTYSGPTYSRLGIGGVTGSTPDPGARWAYTTSELTPTATYTDITGGAAYEGDVTPFVVQGGSRFAMVLANRNGVVSHSMRQAAAITAANRYFYDKSGIGGNVPTDPIGGSASYQGHMSMWAVAMVNDAPATPSSLAPSGTLGAGNLTPTMQSNFSDPNITLPNGAAWDYLNTVQITVRRQSDGVIMWSKAYTATSGERAANQASIVYAGTALANGVTYEWQTRHSDRAGAWSAWTAWTAFSVPSAGSFATPTGPTGRQTTVTPGPFTAVWNHASALSTNAVEIRLSVGGTIVQTTATLALSVANGATASVSWATSGFATLSWGTPYTVEMRGRDTANVWSAWSPVRSFFTNTAPSVPAPISPADAAVTTSYPLLRVSASDADGDSLTISIRIKNSGGTVLFTRTATLVSGEYRYQVTGTDFASYATYKWDAYSYDGHFYSGQVTSSASATTSTERTIVYAQGPGTTITSPADASTITSTSPTVTWTATGQVSRQVRVYDAASSLIHDSGSATTASLSYVIPNAPMSNGQAYRIEVSVTDTNSLVGVSTVTVTLSYPVPVAPGSFAANPVSIGTDAEATAVLCTWSVTTYAAPAWLGYDLYRIPLSDIGGSPSAPVATKLITITNPQQTAYLDATGASRVAYEYRLVQRILSGTDTLTSATAASQTILSFTGVVLGSYFRPETFHIYLQYGDGGVEGVWDYGQDVSFFRPTGGQKSRAVRGPRSEWNPSGKYHLIGDRYADADARLAALRALLENGGTLCYRDGRGQVRYVAIAGTPKITHLRLRHLVELQMQEVDFAPGASVTGAA